MSVRSLILPLLAVLWLWPITAYGQSPELKQAYNQFSDFYSRGRCLDPITADSRYQFGGQRSHLGNVG